LVDTHPNCSSVADLDYPFVDLIELPYFGSRVTKGFHGTDVAESFLAKLD